MRDTVSLPPMSWIFRGIFFRGGMRGRRCYNIMAGPFSGTGDRVMTSTDGNTWTSRTSAADSYWMGITRSEELGLFLSVADAGTERVMYSSDGISWTAITLTHAAAEDWKDVAWSSELRIFVAVSDGTVFANNTIMKSNDGITWLQERSSSDILWNSIIDSPDLGGFCAVGNGKAVTSALIGSGIM